MNPNNPLEYLNQIAPQQHKTGMFSNLKPIHYIAGGVIIVLLLILVIGLIAKGGNGPIDNMQHLMARLKTTETIAAAADKSIKSSQLSVINSNLDIYLTNTNRDIVAPFKSAGVTAKTIDKTVTNAEKGTQLSARLEDARLNAVFDSTYAREMSYQLSTILTLMKQIYQATNNQSVKSFLQDAYKNLSPTQESFDAFQATTEA